jgi:Putative prokaryotic signal transducing protein
VEIAVQLTTVGSEMEANIIYAMLRADGIKCSSRQADLAASPMRATGRWHEILVAPRDLQAARKLLAGRPL